MRAIIVDDEQPALDMLGLLLAQDGRIHVSGAYRRPKDALEQLADIRPSVAFLDVDMPMMNGMELARQIHKELDSVEIVFVTAYSEYALEAFRCNALDYVLKPLKPEAIVETVDRLLKRQKADEPTSPSTQSRQLKASLFGRFDILDINGQPIRWRTLKVKELMAYFLAKEGQPVSKWVLMSDLWPEYEEAQSRTYLHTSLYHLKKAIKDAGGRDCITYVSSQYYADFGNILNPLQEYRSFGRSYPPLNDRTAVEYQRLISLYHGELFAKLDYPWSHPYRESYFRIYREMCIRLSGYYLQIGNSQAAAYTARQLLYQSEIDEDAHEIMLKVHYQRNNLVSLMQQYELLKSVLHSELGISPKPEVRNLYAAMLQELGVESSLL